MRVINIIKDIRPIRMGVFTAATNTASHLLKQHNVISELWFPGSDYGNKFEAARSVSLPGRSILVLKKIIKERNLQPESDIIVTHSPWSFQSRWGNYLARQGFKWVFLAHGILQPNHMMQKWLKKKIYYELYEKRLLSKVNVIRAISESEKKDLQKKFHDKRIVVIPNGCEIAHINSQAKKERIIFLFMSRLHHQKRLVQLAKAWVSSSLNNQFAYELIIAGPDDGEMSKLEPILKQSSNVRYVGAIYHSEKEEWLNKSTFFILPSIGEGFSVSVVEAAARGVIPVITEGCNFPEILEIGLAVKTGIDVEEIKSSLKLCAGLNECTKQRMSNNIMQFIKKNYSLEIIAQKQYELYKNLLQS